MTNTSPIRATTYVGRWPNIPFRESAGLPKGTFSPTTSVLISGPAEAVLIDAQNLKRDVEDLGDIERTGKKLTAIYVTHAHADHYGGAEVLQKRFPDCALCGSSQCGQGSQGDAGVAAEGLGQLVR